MSSIAFSSLWSLLVSIRSEDVLCSLSSNTGFLIHVSTDSRLGVVSRTLSTRTCSTNSLETSTISFKTFRPSCELSSEIFRKPNRKSKKFVFPDLLTDKSFTKLCT
uniref:Secreted protein n=1 Tax=Cacopsylla melanoneura TaxID=428564 RepID=A0A8D9F797_9HEMI